MANGEWFYAHGNEQQGPVAPQAFQDMVRGGQIKPTTLVWRQGMPNWAPAGQVPELSPLLPAQPEAEESGQPQAYAPPPYFPPGAQYSVPGGRPQYPQPQQFGYGPGPLLYPQNVPNYLVPAILTTVFCCLPFGIVSIVYAAQVNSKLAAGDVAGAMDSSQKAKTWAMWSFGVTVVGFVAYIGFFLLLTLAGAAGR